MCIELDCTRPNFRRGLCYGHWKYGDPDQVTHRVTDLEQVARIAIEAHQG